MESLRIYKPVISINESPRGVQLTQSQSYTVELNVCKDSWTAEFNIVNELLTMRLPYFLTLVGNGNAEPGITTRLLHLASVFLMGSSYIRKNEDPVIGLKGVGDAVEIKQILSGYFRGQGFQDICFLNFAEPDPVAITLKEGTFLTVKDTGSIKIFSGDTAAINAFVNKYVYFKTATVIKSLELESEMHRQIVNFLNSNKEYDLLVRRLIKAETRLEAAEGKNILQDRKLSIAESFVDVARSKYKDDYESLFEYYHKEYEVLPIWFKRLGHIIKVLTGHRKFKSLISDEAKEKNKHWRNATNNAETGSEKI
jgi:hypothetical protein